MYDVKEKISNKNLLNEFIKQHTSGKFTIHDDLTVDVDGSVDLNNSKLEVIPCQFGIVNGSFSCTNNKLTSLLGSPFKVNGHFFCENNQLTSLDYCPSIIHGHFNCSVNQLSSLKGGPKELIDKPNNHLGFGDYNCSHNPLIELNYLPKKLSNFYCRNTKITSLKNSPEMVENYHAESNPYLKELNLEGVNIADTLYLNENPNLTNLQNGPQNIGLGLILPTSSIKNLLDINFAFTFIQHTIDQDNEKIEEFKDFYKRINKTESNFYFRLELNINEFEMLKLKNKLSNTIDCVKEGKKQKI